MGDDFITQQQEKIDYKKLLINNFTFLGYILINFGIYKLLQILNLSTLQIPSILILLGINIFGFILAILINLKLRDNIFHLTIYLIEFLILLKIIINKEPFFEIINLLSILNFSIYTFCLFILSNFSQIGKNIKGLWFLFLNILILLNLYKLPFSELSKSAFSLQIYLLILFGTLALTKFMYNKLKKLISKKQPTNIIEEIINGNHPFLKKEEKRDWKELLFLLSKQIYKFIDDLPNYIKFLLGFLNLITIFLQIIIFIKYLGKNHFILENELFYWGSIVIFFINFLFLKYLNFYHMLQRIFIFFILNFGIYLSILNIFGKNFLSIAIYGIIRNLTNSFLIFLTSNLLKKNFLIYEDILLRIIANILAIPVNIYFLMKASLIYDLKLAILGIYIGIQLILIYYNFKFLEKIKG